MTIEQGATVILLLKWVIGLLVYIVLFKGD